MEIYCNDQMLSRIVNDGIREFDTFLRKDLTRTKSKKSTKSNFLHLRCFYAHKKHNKHKTSNKGLLPLRCFHAHKNAVFFIFICLCAFCAFCTKQATFFLLDVFYAHLKLFLFLLAYVRFALSVHVGSFRKWYKTP